MVGRGRFAAAAAAGFAVERVVARARRRRVVAGIVALAHVPELLGGGVDAPFLVGPGDEGTLFVPALHPRGAAVVVGAEEADLDALAAVVFDHAVLFSELVVRIEEPAFDGSGVDDGDGVLQRDVLLGM